MKSSPGKKSPLTIIIITNLVLTTAVALLIIIGGCGNSSSENPPEMGIQGGPPPEIKELEKIVDETRAILPRVPGQAQQPKSEAPVAPPKPRQALRGAASLLRPGAFPRLPSRLIILVFLDERTPPGGYLEILKKPGEEPDHWKIISGYMTGERAGDFSYNFRVSDPDNRLRYFVLLGLRYMDGKEAFRSLEGYLIFPGKGGTLSTEETIYPIDFGYRWPEIPLASRQAERLKNEISQLELLRQESERLAGELEKAQNAVQALSTAEVPAPQEQQRQADLLAAEQKLGVIALQIEENTGSLESALVASYRLRAKISAAWRDYSDSNSYRWLLKGEKVTAYRPLAGLAPLIKALPVLDGNKKVARAIKEMEKALMRELESAPTLE